MKPKHITKEQIIDIARDELTPIGWHEEHAKYIDGLDAFAERLVKLCNISHMDNEIKLLKNNDNRTDSDVEKLTEFYRFLTGEEMPKSISMSKGHAPKMTEKKAMSIIWYLQEHLSVFPDRIERCNSCGELYDSNSEGIYWETKGKHFCGGCCDQVPYNYDRGRR